MAIAARLFLFLERATFKEYVLVALAFIVHALCTTAVLASLVQGTSKSNMVAQLLAQVGGCVKKV